MDVNLDNLEIFLLALLALSEVIAVSPLKSNSVFQLIYNIIKAIKVKKDEKKIELKVVDKE